MKILSVLSTIFDDWSSIFADGVAKKIDKKINDKIIKEEFLNCAEFMEQFERAPNDGLISGLNATFSKDNMKKIYKGLMAESKYNYIEYLTWKLNTELKRCGISNPEFVKAFITMFCRIVEKNDNSLSTQMYIGDLRKETNTKLDYITNILEQIEKNKYSISENDSIENNNKRYFMIDDIELFDQIIREFKSIEFVFREGIFAAGVKQLYIERIDDLLYEKDDPLKAFIDKDLERKRQDLLNSLQIFTSFAGENMEPKGDLFIILHRDERYKDPKASDYVQKVAKRMDELAADVLMKYQDFVKEYRENKQYMNTVENTKKQIITLRHEASELLRMLNQSEEGYISLYKSLNGGIITVGGIPVVEEAQDRKVYSKWLDGLEECEKEGLIKELNTNFYRMTGKGFDYIDSNAEVNVSDEN